MEKKLMVSKNWFGLFVPILLAIAVLIVGGVALAQESKQNVASPTGRVFENIFEYRMCLAHDSNWCPNGDDFKSTLFDSMYINPSLGSDPAYYWESGDGEMMPHYPAATVGTLTRHTADFCEAGDPDINGKCPDVLGYDVVRCVDGTRPVFYYEAGQGEDSNRWIFKIQGGGEQCTQNCPIEAITPSKRSHFSSAYGENAETRNSIGIYSNSDDNIFKHHNVVMLDKCFGDRNQGDTTYTDVYTGALDIPKGTGPVYFHGYRVILASLRRLKREFNLSDAESIVFIAQSNGTNGAYHYIDRLTNHISATLGITAPVSLLAQGYVAPSPEIEYFFQEGDWPLHYTDIPSSTETSTGIINAPGTPPTDACGPGFDRAYPDYYHWVLEGRNTEGGTKCSLSDPDEADGGAHGRVYATQDYHDGAAALDFDIWGADNGLTETWDESCLIAHAGDPDLRACRDSQHVMTHHLQTPTFFAAQLADRGVRTLWVRLTRWAPEGNVWWPEDMKMRVEKQAEVISGYQSRSTCADDDLAEHGFFIDNTVDHMTVALMSKLTRPMKANDGPEAGFYFELQHYLRYWLHPSAPTVQCLDSNELYDAEFAPPYIEPISPTVAFPVNNWPPLVQCYDGYYPGGSRPYQGCDDPGFADPTNLNLNRADSRWVCQGPPILERVYLPLVSKR